MSTQLALTAAAAAVLLLAQSTGSPVAPVAPHAPTVTVRPAEGPSCLPRFIPSAPSAPTGWAGLPRPVACDLLVTRARARALERDPLR